VGNSLSADEGGDAARRDHEALEQIERYAGYRGDHCLYRIGVGNADEGLAEMSGREPVERRGDAVLHRIERLTVRELECARQGLNGPPFTQLAQILQLSAGPVPEVALEETNVCLHGEAEEDRQGLSRLLCPLERRAVDGDGPALEAGNPFGSRLGLLASHVGEVQPGCPAGKDLSGGRGGAVADEERDC
jgi:hypothetical protein